MRIAVTEVAGAQQRPGSAQVGADRTIRAVEFGVDDAALAGEPFPVVAVEAGIIDGEDRVDAQLLAGDEIFLAMVGGHMDEAGARVGGDMIGGQERTRAREEAAERVHRVAGDGACERGAFDPPWLIGRGLKYRPQRFFIRAILIDRRPFLARNTLHEGLKQCFSH